MQRSQPNGDEFDGPPEFAPRRAIVTTLGTLTPKKITWLWPDRLATGKLNLLVGHPGESKSLLSVEIAARVSRGVPFIDTRDVANPAGDTVILSCEDDPADTILPRLLAAEGDPDRVHVLEGIEANVPTGNGTVETFRRGFNLAGDLKQLEEVVTNSRNPRLIIVDPLGAYLGGPDVDSHANADVRAVLAPLSDLAARLGVCVLAVHHLNKSSGQTAIHRITGSLAIVAAARMAHLVCRDPAPTQDADPRVRFMLPMKSNLTGHVDGLGYTIEAVDGVPRLLWSPDPIQMTADAALNPSTNNRGEKTQEAVTWLQEQLRDGPVYAKELNVRRQKAKISYFAYKEAKKAIEKSLGQSISRKANFDGEWVVFMPTDESDAQSDGHPPTSRIPSNSTNDSPIGAFNNLTVQFDLDCQKRQSDDLDGRLARGGIPSNSDDPEYDAEAEQQAHLAVQADNDDGPDYSSMADAEADRERTEITAYEAEAWARA